MTSPVLTGVPVAAMWRICIGPPAAGATSSCVLKGLSSPVACTTTGTSPWATRAVGMTLPSVCTPCIGDTAMAAITRAMPSTAASDQPRRLRFGFVMKRSFQRRNRILQRYALTRLHAFAHHELLLAAPRDPHQPLLPAAPRPWNIAHRAAGFFKDGARRDQHDVRHAIHGHADGRIHPRPQPRIHLIDLHDHLEVALWRPGGKIDAW